jgi:hypothetical protein
LKQPVLRETARSGAGIVGNETAEKNFLIAGKISSEAGLDARLFRHRRNV